MPYGIERVKEWDLLLLHITNKKDISFSLSRASLMELLSWTGSFLIVRIGVLLNLLIAITLDDLLALRSIVPPGRCLVLLTPGASALWVTSWPLSSFVKHAWAGAWICSLFRNEDPSRHLSSELIRDAVAATRAHFDKPPTLGMVTFVDTAKVRQKRDGK